MSRPVELRVGDQVRLTVGVHTVGQVRAGVVTVVDVTGAAHEVPVGRLFADPAFVVMTPGPSPAPLAPTGLWDVVPEQDRIEAQWWESHLVEVLTGRPPEPQDPSAVLAPGRPSISHGVRAEYDPARTSLRQRELAKVAELTAAGHPVALTTLQRMRHRYERQGLWGLVDARFARPPSATGRADPRVLTALGQAVAEQTDASTGTVDRVRRRTAQILTETYGDQAPPLPSRTTFYRLVATVSAGKHTFGSARTRRSLAQRPDGPFGTVTALRPGELVQVDSTPLDVRAVLDNGMVDRVDLTWLVDVATRSIGAAVLRPSTKGVDAALLLARALTPEPMRPDWADALRLSRSVLPYRRLLDLDARLEHAAARPVIVPETIVCDHGMVYLSQTFRRACRAMGINLQPTHKGSPWEKGAVERSFDSLGTLFAQYVRGYVGSSVEYRGKDADQQAVFTARR